MCFFTQWVKKCIHYSLIVKHELMEIASSSWYKKEALKPALTQDSMPLSLLNSGKLFYLNRCVKTPASTGGVSSGGVDSPPEPPMF
ncbi:MAG: hypothetical protein H6Q71_2576 [Firmicutes bacterium]|nr:hypothetical protein [Bacillota bacterium]